MRDRVRQVVSGNRQAQRFGAGDSEPKLIFPGSFNPLHDAHRKMAAIAGERFNRPVHYEISVLNVDKYALTAEEAEARISQFDSDATIWLTRTATFVEKAQFFPNSTFVVGADTAIRLLDLNYYRDEIARDEAISQLMEKQCRFLVFGRLVGRKFMTGSSLAISNPADQLFVTVPMAEFREDVSSTELRRESESE